MKCKLLPCPRALPPCALLTISRAARRYSPMHLWTKQARKEALFAPNQSTPFSKRCQVYYHIRKNMEEDPSTINLSYDALRKAASTSESRKRVGRGQMMGAVMWTAVMRTAVVRRTAGILEQSNCVRSSFRKLIDVGLCTQNGLCVHSVCFYVISLQSCMLLVEHVVGTY